MQQRNSLFSLILGVLTLILLFSPTRDASALSTADVTNDQPKLDFPNSITFQAQISNTTKITSVVLEYGDQEETCGQVIAEAYPQFTPGESVDVSWTWDMRQSGSLPPGAQIWWRWRYTDDAGKETVTDQKTITWLDSIHNWQALSQGEIRLHWYQSDQNFAQKLLDNAVTGLKRVEQDAGLSTDKPIDLYIYANTNDMKDAILYEPAWTGGEAYPEYNIVIIGIGPSDLSWGLQAEVHELTHVIVGHLTFSCLGSVPTWLNEGLAVYSEGNLDQGSQTQLDNAIKNDTLLSVRSLSGPFSEIANKANLSYSESYSIVKFLIQTYGRDKMTALLLALRDGNTIDAALNQVYGFNVEGLEDVWRADIGAWPHVAAPNPTAAPTPTIVPTIVPLFAQTAVTTTPLLPPTARATAQPTRSIPPLSLTATLACICLALALVLGVIVVVFILVMKQQKKGKDENDS